MSWFKNKNREDDEAAEASVKSGSSVAKPAGEASKASSSPATSIPTTSTPAIPATGGFVAPELSLVEKRFGKLRSALGPGTEVQGRLSFDSAVSLDGVLKGTIRSTELIVVSKLGRVDATSLVAKALVIEGEVTGGDITVSERLEVLSGGKFVGTVSTPILVVADGGVFDGVCNMTSREEAAAIPIPPLSATSTSTSATPKLSQSGAKPSSTSMMPSPSTIAGENNIGKKKISMDELLGK